MLKYQEFIDRVNEAGFLTPFSSYLPPDIAGQEYTGDPETDPRIWRTRAAQEQKLACGYFFNGKPGYIAPRFLSIFIDAFRPPMTMEDRRTSGKLGQYEWEIWNLLNNTNRTLGWHEFWQMLGVTAKEDRKALEAALLRLQMTLDVTISGTSDILHKSGEGHTKCIGYTKMDVWAAPEWMEMIPRMGHQEALELLYRQAEKGSSAGEAKKAFVKSLKLRQDYC